MFPNKTFQNKIFPNKIFPNKIFSKNRFSNTTFPEQNVSDQKFKCFLKSKCKKSDFFYQQRGTRPSYYDKSRESDIELPS